jgi:hypothetical protein
MCKSKIMVQIIHLLHSNHPDPKTKHSTSRVVVSLNSRVIPKVIQKQKQYSRGITPIKSKVY